MAPELTPDSLRNARFRTALRGADQSEVKDLLEAAAAQIEALQEQKDRLASRLGEFAERDLKTEFEKVGNEITEVLEAARQAAETMRERATLDAARWRSEAMAESEKVRKDAKNDAEALRGDAWTTGTDLLNQASAEVKRTTQQAERNAITITGEAEREAHRLVSAARREAEDLVRTATMDAEKLNVDAQKAHDQMIDDAIRQAEASQERTRALEQRREELMEELDAVRSTLSQLEGTLEAKREDLSLSRTPDSSVKVVPSGPVTSERTAEPPPQNWSPGETVRVIHPPDREPELVPTAPPSVAPKEKAPPQEAEETVEVVEAPAVVAEPEPAADPDESGATADLTEPAPVSAPPPSKDEVGELFASLREPGSVAPVDEDGELPAGGEPEPQPAETRADEPKTVLSIDDELLENRDSVLLPISNRALRGTKRAITEAQNIALDSLRTESSWLPDEKALTDILRAEIVALWAESYSAGHHMAEALSGAKLKRPSTPSSDAAETFGAALASSLESELSASGDGQRERQSAASRVFRGWRTDESERRIRELALRGYHRGLIESGKGFAATWVPAGTPCTSCRIAAKDPAANLPPVHTGCECSVTIS